MDADYAAAYARLYREHWWWRVREDILLRQIRHILKGRPPGARILDVGCGAGLFFDALERLGHVEGIESDRLAVAQAGRWRDRIHIGELDDAFQPDSSFDLILLLDVVEHVDRPDRLLRRAASLLGPTGRIVVTVPAFNWLWTSHDELNHHVQRYTAKNLRDLMSAAGLTAIETSYLFQSLVLPKLLVRAKEALTAPAARVPRVPARAMNIALQAWYRSEYMFAGWLPFGSSVLAIAQRSPHAPLTSQPAASRAAS
jgi:2-polyprenyl-3-methyl-5-hydroxy-6-metoxy-1,4-benzoquinol methylase